MKFESKFKSALLLACLGFSATNVSAQYLKAGDINVGDSGCKFRVSQWKNYTYSPDDNFYISRVKPKARFYNAKTQVNPDFIPWWKFDKSNKDYTKYSKKLLMWTPIGSKSMANSSYTTIPDGLYNEEMFSMWQYVSTWGTWTDAFMRVPGNFVDVAHKNGVAVTTQASIGYNSKLDGYAYDADNKKWVASDEAKWLDTFNDLNDNASSTVKYLDWFGLDGIGYNSEWYTQDKKELTIVESLNEAIAKHFSQKNQSVPSFSAENIWYDGIHGTGAPTFDNGIDATTIDYFGKEDNKRTSFFFNYNWNGTTKSYGYSKDYINSSVEYAIDNGRNPFDLYAGFNLQGKEPYTSDKVGKENGTWPYIVDKGVSIGLWSGHDSNMFWETRNSNGSNPETAQANYQRVLERWFSGSKFNPSSLLEDEDLKITSSMSSDPDDKFFGMAKFVAAQSTRSWDLSKEPFVTYFNLGNGKFFNWKGQSKLDNNVQASREEWSNIGIQDYLPTWRWWWSDELLNGKSVPTSLTAAFAWNQAYFGGSSLRITGTSSTDAVLNLFKTNFKLQHGDVIYISYLVNKGSAKIDLMLGGLEGTSEAVTAIAENEIDTKDGKLGVWTRQEIQVDKDFNLDLIALKFKDAENLDVNIGELSIVRPNGNAYEIESFKKGDVNETLTTSNHGIKIDDAKLLGKNMYGLDGKIIFHLGEEQSTLSGHYNADHKVSMFNIYAKTTYTYTEGTETKTKEVVTLMGSTTSWAGLFFKAPYDAEFADKETTTAVTLNIGVSAVALDMATESDIAWSDPIKVKDGDVAYETSEDITVSSDFISGGDSFTVGYKDPIHSASYWVLRGPKSGTNAYNDEQYVLINNGSSSSTTFDCTATTSDDKITDFNEKELPYGMYDVLVFSNLTDAKNAKDIIDGKVTETDNSGHRTLPSLVQIYNSKAGKPIISKFVAIDNDNSDAISVVTEETAKGTNLANLKANAAGRWAYKFEWGNTGRDLEADGLTTLPGAGIKVKPNVPLTLKFEAKSNILGAVSKGVSLEDKSLGVSTENLDFYNNTQGFTVAFWIKIKELNGKNATLLSIRNPEEEIWPDRAWGWLWSEIDQNGNITVTSVRTSPGPGSRQVDFKHSNCKLEKNAWYHIAYVINDDGTANSSVKLYVNGKLVTTTGGGEKFMDFKTGYLPSETGGKDGVEGTFSGANSIMIGGIAGKGAYSGIDGVVDNFQIYNKAISESDVKNAMLDVDVSAGTQNGQTDKKTINISTLKTAGLVGFWDFENTYSSGYDNAESLGKTAKMQRFQYPTDNEDGATQTKQMASASTTVGYPALNQGISQQKVDEAYEIVGATEYKIVQSATEGTEVGGAEGSLTVQSSSANVAPAKIRAKKAKLDEANDKYVGYAEVTFPNLNKERADKRGYDQITLAVYTAKLTLTNSIGADEALYKYIYVLDWDKEITTSVDNVKAGELSICPMKNGAIFTCAEDVKVNLFDLNGRLVKNFNLNGSEFVELAPGIYIANGKKFIVK